MVKAKPRRNMKCPNGRGIWNDSVYWVAHYMHHVDKRSFYYIANQLNTTYDNVQRNLEQNTLPPSEREKRQPPPLTRARKNDISLRRTAVKSLAKMKVQSENGIRSRRLYPSTNAIRKALPRGVKKPSKMTIWRDLGRVGLKKRKRQKGPRQLPGDPQIRKKFCKAEVKNAEDPSNKYLFSDECIASDDDHGYINFEYVEDGEEPSRLTQQTYPTKVHFWVMIGVGIKKIIIFPLGLNIEQNEYQRLCLMPCLRTLQREGVVFMHDGAKAHTALSTQVFLCAHNVKYIKDWPSRSPDLNPVENLFALLKRMVDTRLPTSREELVKAIVEEFKAIPQEKIDKYVRSYAARLRECIRRGGETIQTKLRVDSGFE